MGANGTRTITIKFDGSAFDDTFRVVDFSGVSQDEQENASVSWTPDEEQMRMCTEHGTR